MADVMSQTPPPLQGPSDKERKYDRQLRLWAAAGQAALESSNILLVNSGSGTVGVETLKNLVLPGIGKFTIVDDAIVGDADLGVNFFLDEASRGKSRAQCNTELLLELNPEVSGDWFPKSQGAFDLGEALSSATPYTIILYTFPIDPANLALLQEYGRQHSVPLVAIHSVGFYGYFRVSLPGVFPIVDTHPDETATADLRLLTPWPELSHFAEEMTKDIDNLDAHEHGHIPLVVILLHYLEAWKASHGGSLPTSYSDKTAFREIISGAMRTNNPEGGEENFEEAVGAVMKHITTPSIPSSLQEVFDYDYGSQHGSSFWVIAEAVKQFYRKHQQLPVTGRLPDMKAQSKTYIALQSLYKNKARKDAAEVLDMAHALAADVAIDADEVEMFCTNAKFIKLINADKNTPSMDEIIARELGNDEIAAVAGPEMPSSLISIYFALNATSHAPEMGTAEIIQSINRQAPALQGKERTEQIAQEVARAAGGELHNVSATLGGMAAQEVIKVVTKQYIPVDNTCIYDGIESRCQVLRT